MFGGPFEGAALVPKAVVGGAWVFSTACEVSASEEAEEVEAVGWADDYAWSAGGEEIEWVFIVCLEGVTDLQPATMDVELDWPSSWWRRGGGHPDVEIEAVFGLDISYRRGGRRVLDIDGIESIVRLRAHGTE